MRRQAPSRLPGKPRPGAGRRTPSSSLLLVLLALLASALPARGNSNHRGEWSSYETRRFKVVFHEEVRAQADFARGFLEEAYDTMLATLQVPDRGHRITVVLTGRVDESNGAATPLGHRIVIWTRPAQVIAAPEMAWLRRVLAHELAHQVTFLSLRNLFGIYGELYKTLHMPIWFVEGLAQYLGESWDAKRATFFAHAVHNSALEAYPALAGFTRQDPINSRLVYEQGHAFVRYLAANHGGGAILGRILRSYRCIPLWTELKMLLSPMTAGMLPLEGAIRTETGRTWRTLYRAFLDSLEAGKAPGHLEPAVPLVPGTEGLAAVLHAKRLADGDWVVAAQASWDAPHTDLYRVRAGRPEPLGIPFANPVFDVSPAGGRLAYVRELGDVDGEPVNRLRVRDLASGRDIAVADGAYHPAFLAEDTVAFSRWRLGRQTLALCAVPAGGVPACREEAPDSLVGFWALSRSSRGLLLNATDAAGRSGIWEWSRAGGFRRILQDTVTSEFPVEAEDGSVWMVRESGGLLQAAALDRETGAVRPLATFPSGAFLLHRAAPGPGGIAAVAQVRAAPRWRLGPVAVVPAPSAAPAAPAPAVDSPAALPASPPAADAGTASAPPADALRAADTVLAAAPPADSARAAADSGRPAADSARADATPSPAADTLAQAAPAYRVPGFLREPPLLPPAPDLRAAPAASAAYRSLLAVRPLLLWPYVAPGFPEASLGAGGLLQDPLELHTLTGSVGFGGDGGPIFDAAYANDQTALTLGLAADNAFLDVDSLADASADSGRAYVAVRTRTFAEASITGRPPWALPRPHSIFLSAAAGLEAARDRVGISGGPGDGRFTPWSRERRTFHHRLSAGWIRAYPYAYAAAHPLRESSLGLSHVRRYPDGEDFVFGEARHTFPVAGELTLTGFWQGGWYHAPFRRDPFELPSGDVAAFFRRREQGLSQDAYVSLAAPLLKGYLAELPFFGVWNFLGAGLYGSWRRDDFAKSPWSAEPRLDSTGAAAGARLFSLFHVGRKFPLVLSAYAQVDLESESAEYGLSTEVGGLPTRVSGWLAPGPLKTARGLKARLGRTPRLP